MATVTRRLGGWDNEQVIVEMDYNDLNMRALAIRVINGTSNAIHVAVTRESDGLLYETRFGPGTTFINIPTTVAGRITMVDLGRGQFSGYRLSVSYPYP